MTMADRTPVRRITMRRIITRALRGLFGALPAWAQADHPIQRYQRGGEPAAVPRSTRLLRAFIVVMGGAVLLLIGLFIATAFTHPAGANWVEAAHFILYFPLIGLQIAARIAAVGLTTHTVSDEMRRQNWDNLRATERGAELNLRARWASVFYRLRGLLGVIVVLRVSLLLMLLWDLTAFQGRYIDLLLSGITPQIDAAPGILLLSALMTAGVLLPITGIGFDGALGLAISASFTQHSGSARTGTSIAQALYILARIALTVGLLLAATRYLDGSLTLTDPAAWLLMFAAAAFGDWGLALLYLERAGELWATVPHGVFLGLALLAFALLQSLAADQLLNFAARRAQARG